MGDRKRGRRTKEQWRKRDRKIESRVLEEKQIGGVGVGGVVGGTSPP